MNKSSVVAIGLLMAVSAQAEPGTSYLSAGIGASRWNEDCTGIPQCDKTGNAVRLVGGHEFVKGVFAIEAMFLDLGKISAANGGLRVEIKGRAAGVGAAVFGEFAPNWRGSLRLGVASVHAKGTATGLPSESKTSAQAYAGLGVSYAFTPNLFVEAGFDGTRVKLGDQTESVSALLIGLGLRF